MKLEWMLVLAITVVVVALGTSIMLDATDPVPLTCAESRQEYDALRMCMQTADRTGCKMQVEDFARHAELELQLTECE